MNVFFSHIVFQKHRAAALFFFFFFFLKPGAILPISRVRHPIFIHHFARKLNAQYESMEHLWTDLFEMREKAISNWINNANAVRARFGWRWNWTKYIYLVI